MLRAQIRLLGRQIEDLRDRIDTLVEDEPGLLERRRILLSVPGIGPECALALLVELPELGHASDKEIAALVGVAPLNRDSGPRRGRRQIGGGRRRLRSRLYMGALAARTWNPSLRAFYQRLKARGKPSLVALTAVLRKLILLANALIRDGRTWQPENP